MALVLFLIVAALQAWADGRPAVEHHIPAVTGSVHVDALLDEPQWQQALSVELKYETRQTENGAPPVSTQLLLMHDDSNVYVAFKAADPEPSKIRAHFTDRDRAFDDDFVGVSLDTFNDQRRGVEFFVNPLGVQMDLTVNDVDGGNEDESWDAIWQSAGKVTAAGYTVEMAIPFSSLRFESGSGEKRWGINAVRNFPREKGYQIGLAPRDRSRDCYLCQIDQVVGFQAATPGRNIELTPTLVTSSTQSFDDAQGALGKRKNDVDAGFTARWGITPNLTLQGTVNPDFSQVEADSLQLAVNEQFALFYPEKRPFFLEGADLFQTPINAVYTRTIANPDYGVKLGGKLGDNALGVFVARDNVTNLLIPGPQGSGNTSLDQSANLAVLRYRRDIGKGSTLGVIGTDRRGDSYENRVIGVDSLLRFSDSDKLALQWITSSTRYPRSVVRDFAQPEGDFTGSSFVASYEHQSRHWGSYAVYKDNGKDFRADLGFQPQADLRRAVAGGGYTWRGDSDTWYSRLHWGGDWDRTEQHDGIKIEEEWESWFEFNGPRQSYGVIDIGTRDRQFGGVTFNQNFLGIDWGVTPVGGLTLSGDVSLGDDIDFRQVRPGKRVQIGNNVSWKVGRHLNAELAHLYRVLDHTDGWLFRANLTELRLVWQFDTRLFVRLVAQRTNIATNQRLFDDPVEPRSRDLLGQFLASYKINPVTALYVGYTGDYFEFEKGNLEPTGRTIFVKLGYAFVL